MAEITGKEKLNYEEVFKRGIEIMREKTGIEIHPKEIGQTHSIFADFKNGRIFAVVVPIVTNKKPTCVNYAFYSPKELAGNRPNKTIEALALMAFCHSTFNDYITDARKLLSELEIKSPATEQTK